MKTKFNLLLATLCLMSIFAVAQHSNEAISKQKKHMTPEMRMQRLSEKIQLSETQKAEVLELYKQQDAELKKHRKQMNHQQNQTNTLSEEQKAKIKEKQMEFNKKMEIILGAKKYEEYKAFRAHQTEKIKRQHAKRDETMQTKSMKAISPENRAAKLKAKLALTDAEASALVEVFKQQETRRKTALKQVHEQMKKQNDTEIESIIGKEKMLQLKELRMNHQKK